MCRFDPCTNAEAEPSVRQLRGHLESFDAHEIGGQEQLDGRLPGSRRPDHKVVVAIVIEVIDQLEPGPEA